jgi:hypothetical protein
MTTRTVLAWIAEAGAWDPEALVNTPAHAGSEALYPENRTYHLPTADEIRAATQEIRATWTERERLNRLVGGSSPESWTVPSVRTSGVPEPND